MKIIFWFWLSHLLWAIILSFLLFSSLGSMAAKANELHEGIYGCSGGYGNEENCLTNAETLDQERRVAAKEDFDKFRLNFEAQRKQLQDEEAQRIAQEPVKGIANNMLLTLLFFTLVYVGSYILTIIVILGIPVLLIYFLIVKPIYRRLIRYTGAQWRGEP